MKTLIFILGVLILIGCEKEIKPDSPILISPSVDVEAILPIEFSWQSEADQYWFTISEYNESEDHYDVVYEKLVSDTEIVFNQSLVRGEYYWSVEGWFKDKEIWVWSGHRKFIIN